MACESGINEAIALLVPMSNLGLTNRFNQTPLHLAARLNVVSDETLQMLVTEMIANCDWTVIHLQVILQLCHVFRELA